MSAPKVTIGVVVHTKKYLDFSLPCLIHQDYENLEILIRDQSEDAGVHDYLINTLKRSNDSRITIRSGKNLWHSGGHNDLIRQMSGDYYICASQDMFYETDFVSQSIKALESAPNKSYGTATVKLLQWDFESASHDLSISKTNIIDSCGIARCLAPYFFDRGQGYEDQGQFDQETDIFGASGALIIFRKSALDAIAYQPPQGPLEYFDEMIHYKNDLDMAARLQWAGQKCRFLPDIKLWHDRQLGRQKEAYGGFFRYRFKKSRWEKENSFWGYLVVMEKNFRNEDFSFGIEWATFWYHFRMFLFITFFEPYLWKQFFRFRKQKKEILQKKSAMPKLVSAGEIEAYFQGSKI